MSKHAATPWTMEKLHTRRVVRGPKGELVMVIERGCSDEDAEAMLSALNAHESNQEKIRALVEAGSAFIKAFDDACRVHKNHMGRFTVGELDRICALRDAIEKAGAK